MDPRPFHFDYRKPRVNNPTFKSLSVSETVYQLNNSQTQLPSLIHSPEKKRSNPFFSRPKNPEEPTLVKASSLREINQSSLQRKNEKQSVLAGSGRKSIENSSQVMMDQKRIYENQQKHFDIISFYPKEDLPRLKNYPKLTMEDKLYEGRTKARYQSHEIDTFSNFLGMKRQPENT